jgi:hypothetical protein
MRNWGIVLFVFICSASCFSGETDDGSGALGMKDIPVSVRVNIGEGFKGPESKWWVRDITSSYSWLENSKILLVLDSESEQSSVVYLDDFGKAVVLNKKGGFGQIRNLLAHHFVEALNDSKEFKLMLDVLKDWVIDPRSYVGSEDFFARQEPVLDSWLLGEVKDSSVFKMYCVEPDYSYDETNGDWSVSFYVFNPEGGVNLVRVSGRDRPFRIDGISVDEARKAGSFYFPDEF